MQKITLPSIQTCNNCISHILQLIKVLNFSIIHEQMNMQSIKYILHGTIDSPVSSMVP
jgi:hypothetical protein